MSLQGRVVWHDLNTNDLGKAKAFYGELFNWDIRAEGEWNLLYSKGSDEHFGAMMALHDPATPPHWLPYLTVENLDQAMAAVTANGGALHTAKMSAGKSGDFAVAADPQGAAFTLWQYAAGQGKPEQDTPLPAGRFCWDELMTPDPDSAKRFYGAVVGWQSEDMPMQEMTYTLWKRPGALGPDGKPRQAGGLMKSPPGVPHPFWCSYVLVDDCDASAARAKQLGGTVVMAPTDIPNVGRFATLIDPTGAAISILAPARRAA